MATLTFSKFTHLKAEAIDAMMEKFGKINLMITPKNHPKIEYTLLPKEKAEYLEHLEIEYCKRQKELQWAVENKDAIMEQNERIRRRGLFSDTVRRF